MKHKLFRANTRYMPKKSRNNWTPPKKTAPKSPRRWRTMPTSLVIPEDLKEVAARVAAKDRRSVSNLIILALAEYLVRRGYYHEPDQLDEIPGRLPVVRGRNL